MKAKLAATIVVLALLVTGLAASVGCDTLSSGANVYLENVTMAMDGRPISGLPSQKANVGLKVSVNKVNISTSGQDTVIKLSPSGATIVVGPNGVTVTGVDPSQIQIEWQGAEQSK
jgi:hypothetical protein